MKPTSSSQPAAITAESFHTWTDNLIANQLPAWFKQASLERLKALHGAFKAHESSRKRLAQATSGLVSAQAFAEQQFTSLVEALLPNGPALDGLEWLESWYEVSPIISTPSLEERYRRSAARLRLMQNFPADASFFVNTGLVATGASTVLAAPDPIVSQCRRIDAGKHYQRLLGQILTASNCALLAEHKRDAFTLMCELALCRGQVTDDQYRALSQLASKAANAPGQALFAEASELRMLGCTVENALKIQLLDGDKKEQGVFLYLPDDAQPALRRFDSMQQMALTLVSELASNAVRRDFHERVRLRDRDSFSVKLKKRLADPVPDLELAGGESADQVFTTMADTQVARLKDDGRLLLVSNADADQRAANQRLERWSEVGYLALGLAGLGIPIVGVVLFGAVVVDTLKHVYEGVVDWSEGHQHEALEHLFHVAETVALTAAMVAGGTLVARAFARSDFVDELEPVTVGKNKRLWNAGLEGYRSDPGSARLLDNGLYADDSRRWLRIDEHYYEIHQQAQGEAWRLRHPLREDAYGPPVDFNGERSWRIRLERPLEWDDSTQMLNRLWPMEPPLSAETADNILRVAGIDKDELRGVLVENRPAPVSLRDTLRRFTAAGRVSAVLDALDAPEAVVDDAEVLAWCRKRSDMQGLDDKATSVLLRQQRGKLRGALQRHFSEERALEDDLLDTAPEQSPEPDKLLERLNREFPGLPNVYAEQLLREVEPGVREAVRLGSRLPLSIQTRARSLLSHARLTRAMEGLLLDTSYSQGTGELVLALLPRLENWPGSINFELREGSEHGRLISVLNPQGAAKDRTVLARKDGEFHLYDNQGIELDQDIEAPGGIFQAIVARMSTEDRQKLKLAKGDVAEALRKAVIRQLPHKRSQVESLLGWRASTPWFNPGKRLPDGRVGYTLGGSPSRLAEPGEALRRRVRALYPSLSLAEVDRLITEWSDRAGDAIVELLSQETNFNALNHALDAWEREPLSRHMRSRRRQFSSRLRAAWRYEGETVRSWDDRSVGRVLSLEGWHVGTLPALPAEVDLSHIYELRMSGMDLQAIPSEFLERFDALERLNLNNNRLARVPAGISRLPKLRSLQMKSNQIVMDEAGVETLSGLESLLTLVLDFNPLESLNLDFTRMRELEVLRANRCSLQAVPAGLERCERLRLADLRFNEIRTIPRALLAMPRRFRRRVNLEGNSLPVQSILVYLNANTEESPVETVPSAEMAEQSWIGTGDKTEQDARRERWQRVQRQAGSAELFRLLARLSSTQDFVQAHTYLDELVWQLLEDLDTDAALRDDIFNQAGIQLTCHDSVAERFSRLCLRSLVHHAEAEGKAGKSGASLLKLGRALFRLDRLDEFARHEVNRREAGGIQVDELEVVLGLRVKLADRLGLVGQPKSMLFAGVADITPALEDQAVAAVEADEAAGHLVQSLSNREFWRSYLKVRHAAVFTAHADEFADKLEAIDEKALTSEAYLQACNAVAAEREASEQALMLMFSQDALDMETAGVALDEDSGDSDQSD
ncbi:NEL-type E3 ubiquitin ligase domain-containing protein [Pseudomonas sp. MWU13-3659]|uniref:NEL-type E3 ubiquitin ligase domain-containing protein n=1 Tax=Pseudomonas sp. MWU13-3659 TaxID=2986964 RepID=UPI002075A1E6|nr:NEL-type E3 ubiquitin ligase domain-containing protein [Pseudomonas sp. MWU13-3659]